MGPSVPQSARKCDQPRAEPAFVQDKWKMSDRLTLGLRYDVENVELPENDNPLFDDPNDWPIDRNNFMPRVGFAYNCGDNRTLMRGGYGRFFEKTHFELISGIRTNTPFTTSFTRLFPLNNADPGPLQGRRPDDPRLAIARSSPMPCARRSRRSSRRARRCATRARPSITRIA